MATLLTPASKRKLPHIPNLHRFVYSVPSVLAGSSSPRYLLPVDHNAGILRQIRFFWVNSTTLSLFLGTSDTDFRGTLDEIYRSENTSGFCPPASSLSLIFENSDALVNPGLGSQKQPNLYLEIDNANLGDPTGIISLELIIQAASSRGYENGA